MIWLETIKRLYLCALCVYISNICLLYSWYTNILFIQISILVMHKYNDYWLHSNFKTARTEGVRPEMRQHYLVRLNSPNPWLICIENMYVNAQVRIWSGVDLNNDLCCTTLEVAEVWLNLLTIFNIIISIQHNAYVHTWKLMCTVGLFNSKY